MYWIFYKNNKGKRKTMTFECFDACFSIYNDLRRIGYIPKIYGENGLIVGRERGTL